LIEELNGFVIPDLTLEDASLLLDVIDESKSVVEKGDKIELLAYLKNSKLSRAKMVKSGELSSDAKRVVKPNPDVDAKSTHQNVSVAKPKRSGR
jgi:hypothetical protein